MKKANEMKIDLEDKEYYFPGEILRGRVELNISKPTTTEYITLTFRGWIEWQGEKVELIGESKKLALPISAGQKHTVFKPENKNAFDFEFKIPENINLPSSVKISKVVDIRYTLTAVDKKPLYKKLQTLPTVERTITVLDLIDVELPQFCNEICLSGDLGFLNDIKLTQWNMRSPRSAFLPGEVIPIEVEIKHFPAMNRQRFLKVSLYQMIYRTHNPKVIGKYTIAESSVDINSTDPVELQSYQIPLKIPHSTPPTIFPLNGRIISISYVLCVELNMKDVKSTIFLKDVYTQESVILLGTYTSSGGSISYSYHQQKTLNCSLTPMISNPSSPTDEKSYFPEGCPQSPPLLTKAQRRKTDGQFSLMQEASTIANTSVPNINRHTSCALMRPSKSFEENSGNTTREARQHPIAVPTIPEQPVLSAFLESSAKISQERYNTHAPHEIDQIEPKSPNEDGRHTVFMDSLVLIAEKGCYSNHAPHEIGPQDTICKDSKKKVPELSRYNTESTCSTPGTPQPDSTTVDHLKEIFV